jgi:hypothetical protein
VLSTSLTVDNWTLSSEDSRQDEEVFQLCVDGSPPRAATAVPAIFLKRNDPLDRGENGLSFTKSLRPSLGYRDAPYLR